MSKAPKSRQFQVRGAPCWAKTAANNWMKSACRRELLPGDMTLTTGSAQQLAHGLCISLGAWDNKPTMRRVYQGYMDTPWIHHGYMMDPASAGALSKCQSWGKYKIAAARVVAIFFSFFLTVRHARPDTRGKRQQMSVTFFCAIAKAWGMLPPRKHAYILYIRTL